MRREFERVTCPGCKRRVSAYVPRWGDGSDVKLMKHKLVKGKRTDCPASGEMLGEYKARVHLLYRELD